MIIVHLAAPQSTLGGDFLYRVRQPDAALARLPDITTVSLTNICSRRMELLLGADLVVMQMLADPDLLRVVVERRRLGRPTVFEVSDNFMSFQESNPVAGFYNAPENRAMILQLLSLCDAAQVSMPALAELCQPYSQRVEVFPNQIASTEWVERGPGPMVVGWGGSIGHLEDMKQIAPFLTEWLRRNADVRFMLMGDEQFIPLFSGVSPEQFEFVPSGSLQEYYSFLKNLDVGIAPLSDHPFNSSRSDGKFIEYASRGVVPVCADSPAYNQSVCNGDTGFLFRSTSELIQQLDALRQNPELRQCVSAAAFRYVNEHRTENVGARRRYAFYRSLVKSGDEAGVLTSESIKRVRQLRPGESEHHFVHEFSESEQAAYEGLVSEFNWKKTEHARACYKRAVELEPSFFQARYYLGNFLLSRDIPAAADELRQALSIDPKSVHAAYLLARALFAGEQHEYSLAVARALQCIHPRYAPGFEVEAQILMSLNRPDEAVSPLRHSLEANPYYSPSLVILGGLCLDVHQPTEAEILFRHALELQPKVALVHWGLAVALYAQGREGEALDKCLDAMRIDTDATPAVNVLISTALKHAQSQKVSQAVEVLSKGLEVAPLHPDLLRWRARIDNQVVAADVAEHRT
jgi:tetratricopeptide (TPR) repeat protein